MPRIHLIELHEHPWCPAEFRNWLTEYLETAIRIGGLYDPILPLLIRTCEESGASCFLDLCSGTGGPWLGWKQNDLVPHQVFLTDKYPNVQLKSDIEALNIDNLSYVARAVNLCEQLNLENLESEKIDLGELQSVFRTLFTSLHHFRPDEARKILQAAMRDLAPIAIFECTQRSALLLILSILLAPICVWALTPRMRNRGLGKLFFTYVVPVVPLMVAFDGFVSCLRSYSPEELMQLTKESTGYEWRIGSVPGGWLRPTVHYFIGVPVGGTYKPHTTAERDRIAPQILDTH